MRKVVVFKALGSKCQIVSCPIPELEDVEEGTGDAGALRQDWMFTQFGKICC